MNVKKNGFTLVEVLTVLIILSIVVVIAVPIVDNAIKQSKERSYLIQLQGIEEAAKTWAGEHIFETPNEENPTKTLELSELIRLGYVEKDIINPKTKEPFIGVKVVITYRNGTLEYTVYENGKIVNFD